MKIPFADNAIVDIEKISDYLLSSDHPQGKSKSAFFRRFGFSIDNAFKLREEILKIPQNFNVVYQIDSPYGVKYIIDGEVSSLGGVIFKIRSIWIIEHDMNYPRFITAYPAKE